ncbi:MAG: hypothetical protein WCJ30_23685, partial [Deltaproteobacteria bacterium]
ATALCAGVTAIAPRTAHAQASPAPADATVPVVAAPQPVAPVPPPPPVVETPHPAPEIPVPVRTMHDYLDTRLTWTFGDDDVLAPTGQRVPVSQMPGIGDRQQYQLFFDALNSRFAGRENLTHLVLYSRAPGFIPRVITEASLVLRLDMAQLATGANNLNQAFYDAGTYLRIQYQTNLARPTDGLSLTFFPFDTDRFRLGYLWDLSWGGNDIFPRRVGGAPGLRVAYDSGPFSAFLGFKTANIVVPLQVATGSADIDIVRVQETQYAGLGGVGIRFNDMFRFDANGGFFQQGRFDFPGVRGQPVFLFGGSARIVVNSNLPPSQSIDMLLYRNHPDFPMQLFARETYTPGRVAWMVSLEGTALDQHLVDIDHPGSTTFQPGFARALQGRLKSGYLGVGLTGLYRDVPFLLRNVPSFIPFQSLPNDPSVTVTPEYFVAASIDYRIAAANLLPSFIVGVQFPATFSTSVTEGTLQSQRTLVIRRAGNFSILPPGASALPILSMRLAMRWDLSTIFAIVGWVQYVRDPNGTLLEVDSTGTRQTRVFQAPDQLGFGLTAQARF